MERATSHTGFTGPYLQYTHARLCSMRDFNKDVKLTSDVDFSLLSEDVAYQVVQQVSLYEFCGTSANVSDIPVYSYKSRNRSSLAPSSLTSLTSARPSTQPTKTCTSRINLLTYVALFLHAHSVRSKRPVLCYLNAPKQSLGLVWRCWA